MTLLPYDHLFTTMITNRHQFLSRCGESTGEFRLGPHYCDHKAGKLVTKVLHRLGLASVGLGDEGSDDEASCIGHRRIPSDAPDLGLSSPKHYQNTTAFIQMVEILNFC